MTDDNNQDIIGHLDAALDRLLAVRLALGGPPDTVPDHGLDVALRSDEGYLDARAQFVTAWKAATAAAPGGSTSRMTLDLEAAVNELMTEAIRVGWQMAWASWAGRVRGR